MSLKIAISSVLAGLLLLWGVWQWLPEEGADPVPDASEHVELAALKVQVAELEQQNQMALEQLAELERNMTALRYVAPPAAVALAAPEVEVVETAVPVSSEAIADPQRLQQIQEAGLTPDEFQSMEERAYELSLSGFEDQWQQRRERYLAEERVPSAQERLREDLGDDAYDRYLYASGGSNRVRIRQVMRGSAAEAAGLTDGDVLLSYDDQRIFNFEDLRRSSYAGVPGETVVLEVRRSDNSVSQLVIPRGPMGVSGYRGWREAPGS